MIFVLHCVDKADHGQVRAENRTAHLEYLKQNGSILRLAGPMTSDDGQSMIGTLLVIEVPDRAAAEAFVANDPYVKADLFGDVSIKAFKKVFPPDPRPRQRQG